MPELAEIKIMSEYIAERCSNLTFQEIRVSPEVKKRLSLDLSEVKYPFTLTSMARGKELFVILDETRSSEKTLSISMGMSGRWALVKKNDIPKHSHLEFVSTSSSGTTLCLIDPRRFAKWKWHVSDSKRGPCPLTEYAKFCDNITQNLHRSIFSKPIHLILMDQTYFNGIGNYLRAEILFRADQDPFEEARSAILRNPQILELCKRVPFEAYCIGGGQLKDWKNPFDVPPDGFDSWIKCYGRSDRSIVDKNGRTLWYFDSQLLNHDKNGKSSENAN